MSKETESFGFVIFGVFISCVLCIGLLVVVLKKKPQEIVTRQHSARFEVLDIDRPKHFSVSLLDDNHELWKNVGRSKHCNSWNDFGRPKIHDRITLQVSEYYMSDDETKTLYIKIDNNEVNALWCR